MSNRDGDANAVRMSMCLLAFSKMNSGEYCHVPVCRVPWHSRIRHSISAIIRGKQIGYTCICLDGIAFITATIFVSSVVCAGVISPAPVGMPHLFAVTRASPTDCPRRLRDEVTDLLA